MLTLIYIIAYLVLKRAGLNVPKYSVYIDIGLTIFLDINLIAVVLHTLGVI